jgi:hypothetical protein
MGLGMLDATPRMWAQITQHIGRVVWAPVKVNAALVLLLIASVEALLAPFFGAKFAFASLALAGCAIGYILAFSGVWVHWIGTRADQIHEQLRSLHQEELQKVVQNARQAVPSTPVSRAN